MSIEQMKKNLGAVFAIVDFIFTVGSWACSEYCPNKTIARVFSYVTAAAFFAFLVAMLWFLLGALISLRELKVEKNRLDDLSKTVANMQQQYEEFQTYIEKMEDSLAEKIVCPARKTIFEYKSTKVTDITNNLLDDYPAASIRIICFGRNGYSNVIERLQEEDSQLKAEVIVYKPSDKNYLCCSTDKEDITQYIRKMLSGHADVKVYATNIPPSIRACVISDGGTPIWGAIQYYRFEKRKNGKFSLTKAKESLIPVCGRYTANKDFNGLVRCFNKEFEYLQSDCSEAKIVGEKVKYFRYKKRKRENDV